MGVSKVCGGCVFHPSDWSGGWLIHKNVAGCKECSSWESFLGTCARGPTIASQGLGFIDASVDMDIGVGYDAWGRPRLNKDLFRPNTSNHPSTGSIETDYDVCGHAVDADRLAGRVHSQAPGWTGARALDYAGPVLGQTTSGPATNRARVGWGSQDHLETVQDHSHDPS